MNISATIRQIRRSRAGKALMTLVVAFSLLILAFAPSSAACGAKVPVDLVEINGTAGNDQIRIYRDGTDIIIEGLGPDIALTGVEAITINAGDGDDTLTVDFSGGNPIPSGGITYNGEGNGSVGDALILTGGSFSAVSHQPRDGTIDLDGSSITYSGLEPVVDCVPAATLTVNGNNANNAITYMAGPGSCGAGTSGLVAVDAFETYEFPNKTNLVLNAQSGDDHVVLNNPSVPTSLTSITVNGGEGDDVVDLYDVGAGLTGPVALNGDAGDDLFKVKPSASAVVNIDGGDDIIGDVLVVDPMGGTAVDDGVSQVTFPGSGYQPVNYTNIETVIIQGFGLDPADLWVIKEDIGFDPWFAGDWLAYRVTVGNYGPNPAENVVLVDQLPPGGDFLFGTDDIDPRFNCSATNPSTGDVTLTCGLGTLDPYDQVTLIYLVWVDPDVPHGTVLQNGVHVDSDVFDPDNSNNHDREGTLILAMSELLVNKDGSPQPVTAGEIAHYRIAVVNEGPSTAHNVTLKDELGVNGHYLTFVSADLLDGDGYCYDENFGEDVPHPADVRCNLGDLAVDQAVRIDLQLLVDPSTPEGTILDNFVSMEADSWIVMDEDSDPDEEILVVAMSDLEIEKTSEPAKVNAGQQKHYEIWVTNNGPSDAQGVSVLDVLPDEVVYEIDTGAPMCTERGDLATFQTVLSTEDVIPSNPTGLATLVLDATTNELTYAVNVFDMTSEVTEVYIRAEGYTPPLIILFEGPAGTFSETQPLVGSVVIPQSLADGLLANPADFYVNVETVDNPSGEIGGQMAQKENPPLECELGTIPAGGERYFEMWARVRPDTLADTTITNVAIVKDAAEALEAVGASITFDGSPGHGSPPETLGPYTMTPFPLDPRPRGNLVPGVPAPTPPFPPGETVSFSIPLEHLRATIPGGWPFWGHGYAGDVYSTTTASGVTLTMPPDTGAFYLYAQPRVLALIEAEADDGTTSGPILIGGFGDARYFGFYAEPGRSLVSITITRWGPGPQPWAIGEFGIARRLSFNPQFSNNEAKSRNLVLNEADLKITKFGNPIGQVEAGQYLTYTIIIDNLGPSYAHDVEVRDVLVSSGAFSVTSVTADVLGNRSGATCAPVGGPVTDLELQWSDNQTDWNDVSGELPSFGMVLDPGTLYYYLDVKNLTPAEPLAAGYHPFYLDPSSVPAGFYTYWAGRGVIEGAGSWQGHMWDIINGDAPMFYLWVSAGPSYMLVDGLQRDFGGSDQFLRVNGDYPLGTYEFDGSIEADGDVSNMIVWMTFSDTGPVVPAGPTLICNLDALEPVGPGLNEGRWMIEIVVTADETQDINNVAYVISSDFDPNPDNNQAEVEHDITDVSDLGITKAAQGEVEGVGLVADQVTAGRSLTYTLVITNYGPSTAENVVLEDRLPPWIVVTDADPSVGSCVTGTPGDPDDKLTCGLGNLGLHASATITITANVPSGVPEDTILENDALVYSDIFDDNNGNDFASNLTTVGASADLSVSKIGNPDPVIAGELLEYTVTISNTGPSDASNVVVSDTLPDEVEFVEIRDLYATGVVCSLDPIDEHTLTCVLGDVPAGDVLKFAIVVLVDPAAPATLNNQISVSSDTADSNPGNNTGEDDTGIDREQELFIIKSDSPDPVLAGNELRYAITFGNNGPSEAANVVVTDTLPLGVLFDRCESLDPNDQVTCSLVGGDGNTTPQIVRVEEILEGNTVVYTDTGTIALGDSFTFLLIADVESGYVLNGRGDTGTDDVCKPFFDATGYPYFAHNRADISADVVVEGVPGQATDYDDECTRVNAEADLELTKTDTPDPVSNGVVFTYTITVRNNGPSDSAVVLLTDTLPVDAEFLEVDDSADDLECYFRDDGTLFCLVGNDADNVPVNEPGRLNATSEISFTITVRVSEGFSSDTLVNQAEVQAVSDSDARVFFSDPGPDVYPDDAIPTADPDLDNNTDDETTTVLNPQIRVDKKVFLGNTTGLSDAEIQAKCETEAADGLLILPDTEVTYCYFLYNEGNTWLNEVELTDPPSGYVETAPGPFVNIVGRAGTDSEFDVTHALWASLEGELAPLAPAGQLHPDGYTYLLATRTVTVDFPAGTFNLDDTPIILGSNTATVTATGTTQYSTTYPGAATASEDDVLHDTLALPVLEETTKEWDLYEDGGDGLPSPGDVVEYVVDIPNTGAIEATGVVFTDTLYNYIADDAGDPRVPATLINGSVSAVIHVTGRDPVTNREIDADVAPPDLAFGEDLLLHTQAPGIDLIYPSATVPDSEILKGNNSGDDEVLVATRLAVPPTGELLRFGSVTYDPPIPVTFSLRIKYRVRIKGTTQMDAVVLNHGWLTYNEMSLFDQRFPGFDPANPNANTPANKVAHNHDGTPGRAWESYEFPGWPEVPEGVEPTDYPGPRFDDYALLLGAGLRLDDALRDDDDPNWFKLERLSSRMQLPAIDNAGGWETQIQVQNAGDEDTGAIVFFWGDYSAKCPYSDPGPIESACKRILKNAVWALKTQSIPSTTKSAIAYSVDADLFEQACRDAVDAVGDSAAWQDWEDDYRDTGAPIAVIVQRKGPNDHDTLVSSAYPGISRKMEGGGPPYQYFAPYAMRQYHNLDTEMIIQNSGRGCASIVLNYQKQGDCVFSHDEDIALAPGESIRKRVPEVLGAEWLGSIYIESDESLGIVIDQTSFLPSEDRGVLLTYEARSYKLTTDTVFYGDLVWRELSGWEASIQVQNLTQRSQPTFVTVEFFDQSGNSIFFVGDWVCRAGGKTFYLPAITDLGMEYAGAAEIESHAQVDYPGGYHDGEPIFAVVDLKKTKVYDENLHRWRHTVPGEIQGGAYNALAESDKEATSTIILPHLAKAGDYQGVTSLIAVRNNSNCNKIALKLEVANQVGTVVTYVTNFWLPTKHIKLIDLADVGTINPGFIGAGKVEVTGVEQFCDADNDGQPDQEPVMPSVVVVNRGVSSGDITEVYKGIPVAFWGAP